MQCKHCERRKAGRSRGLCRDCYLDRAIRVRYPSENDLKPRCVYCGIYAACKTHWFHGLCNNCYAFPEARRAVGIRAKRQPEAQYRGSRRKQPAQPTGARPGTDEKIAVMRDRHARGELLYHPKDGIED